MKIAHVISSCSPGGAEIFVKSLVKELNVQGIEVELWVMSKISDISPNDNNRLLFEKNFIREIEEIGIRVKFVGKRPKKDWRKTKKQLRSFYNDFRPNVVHAHLESVTFHVCRALAGCVPMVQTIHNTVISHQFVQRVSLAKKVSKFVAISKKVEEIISSSLNIGSDKICTIYNGIDLTRFVHKRIINEKVKNIIAIGRLTKQKDFPNLFEALKILKYRMKEENIEIPQVKIVGTGKLEEELKMLSKKMKINDIVRFLGVRQDIPDLLKDSDIYVMSSEWEGLSISLIEALASGIPIVATDAGSNNEIIENNISGLIVPIKDPNSLANGLYKLVVDHELRVKLSKNATEKSKLFSIKYCAEKHINLYKELMKH